MAPRKQNNQRSVVDIYEREDSNHLEQRIGGMIDQRLESVVERLTQHMDDFITNYNGDGDRRRNPNLQDTQGSGGYANDEIEVYDDLPPRPKPHMHVEKDRSFWDSKFRSSMAASNPRNS